VNIFFSNYSQTGNNFVNDYVLSKCAGSHGKLWEYYKMPC